SLLWPQSDLQMQPVDNLFLERCTAQNGLMASQGLRVIAVACKQSTGHSIESELCFVGLFGLIDPPRASVAASIKQCRSAGIAVCMITGDHLQTATAIASSLGIYDASDPLSRAIRGRDLDMLTDEALANLKPFPCVFARVSPDNKLAIVRALQSRGELVAMT